MARTTAEIQADIVLTRRLIERQLDAIERRVPHGWWTPYALFAGAIVVGVILSRVPLLRVLKTGARGLRTGVVAAGTVATVGRIVAHRRPAA